MADTNGISRGDADRGRVFFDPPKRWWARAKDRDPDRLYQGGGELAAATAAEPVGAGEARAPNAPVGICLSGGGIRSAAFSLGALQAFGRAGLLRGNRRADYLAAVSGGAYITGAVTLAALGPTGPAHSEPTKASPRRDDGHEDEVSVIPAPDPFAPGTPEETYLRNHLLYLREAPEGIVGALGRVLLGVTFNLAVVTLVLAVSGIPIGWLYGRWFETLRRSACDPTTICPVQIDVSDPLRAAGVLAALAFLAGWVAVGFRWKSEHWRRLAYAALIGLGAAALVEVVAGAAIPKVLQFLRNAGADVTNPARDAVKGTSGGLLALSGASLTGLVTTLVFALRSPTTDAESLPARTRSLVGKLVAVSARYKDQLINTTIAVLGPLLALTILVFLVNFGAYRTPFGAHGGGRLEIAQYLFLWFLAAMAWWKADLVAWSLHPIYKRRLSRAFAVRRFKTSGGANGAEEIPYETMPALSDSQPEDFPEILICAAANVSDYGKTPSGANVTSFVFSARRVGGHLTGYWETEKLEALLNRGRRKNLTLMTAVAVSGAAVSPSMGKMTRRPLRFLITLGNVRLGVWLPNPLRKETFETPSGDQAVSVRPDYFLWELLGRNDLHNRFLYVSDGGHYENLGLVELLRRRCREIWCVDASGDKEDTFSTLGQAIAIARSERLVEGVDLHPLEMGPDKAIDARTVRRTHTTGTVVYPDGSTANLVVIKAGVPEEAPWDVRAFQRRFDSFPCDSTANQLYTGERFEAYRALGLFATTRALRDEGALDDEVHLDAVPEAVPNGGVEAEAPSGVI